MTKTAVIGTAGRDKSITMTRELWGAMVADLSTRVTRSDVLISGGAAWADHLAVHAFLQGWCAGLDLYLPAPMEDRRFVGPFGSAGSTAGYYHGLFSKVVGMDTQAQIAEAVRLGAHMQAEPASPGLGGMFARNTKIARAAEAVLAYTFGEGDVPARCGTFDTWAKVTSPSKAHIRLGPMLRGESSRSRPVDRPAG
jgi:hypothetical protein